MGYWNLRHLWTWVTIAALTVCNGVYVGGYTRSHAGQLPRSAHSPDYAWMSAADIVNLGIAALGGQAALQALKGVSSHAYLYRSQTLEESVTPGVADNTIATAGTQTISYDLSGGVEDIIQRIDKQYMISEYWYFGRGQLEPMNSSLVTRSGSNGYSCYVRGNEGIYSPPDYPNGYADPSLARVLLRDAVRLYPKLLLGMQVTPVLTATTLNLHGISYPAVKDAYLNITVAFKPDTYLPYIIRAYEDHHIYGNSTSDFVLYNYTAVAGVQFPRRIKLMYNEDNMLIDTLIDTIDANPEFATDFFEGIPLHQVKQTVLQIPPVPPMPSSEYGDAEVFENSQNLLWYGGYQGTLANLTITKPVPELPGLYHLFFKDAPAYTTTVAVMEDAIMVTDAPPHQSKLVIQWIKQTLKKSPTHLLITHHHHDHNYGAADFVAAGAKLVVPADFAYYWSAIPGVKFATATADNPFIHRSPSMQVRGVWPGVKDVHAADWMYYTFTPKCPNNSSPFAVEVADAWSPGAVGYEFGQFHAIEYLGIARSHRMPKENLVIPIHGVPSPAIELYALTGYDYPPFNVTDFLPGGPWC